MNPQAAQMRLPPVLIPSLGKSVLLFAPSASARLDHDLSTLYPAFTLDGEEYDVQSDDSHERMRVVSERLVNTWTESPECRKYVLST